MKKIILSCIIGLSLITVLSTSAYAQTLYVDSHVGDMSPISESKYVASALTVTRNSDGELISVVRTDASRYLNKPITDEFLNSDEDYLIKEGRVGTNVVKMYQVEVDYITPECLQQVLPVPGYNDSCNWYHRTFVTMLGINDKDGEHWNLFRGLNHMFSITNADQITSFWTILMKD